MRANGGNAGKREFSNVCTMFAMMPYDVLYGRIIDGSFDIGNDENLLAPGLVHLCGSYA